MGSIHPFPVVPRASALQRPAAPPDSVVLAPGDVLEVAPSAADADPLRVQTTRAAALSADDVAALLREFGDRARAGGPAMIIVDSDTWLVARRAEHAAAMATARPMPTPEQAIASRRLAALREAQSHRRAMARAARRRTTRLRRLLRRHGRTFALAAACAVGLPLGIAVALLAAMAATAAGRAA